jgi:arylsulfatase A-like enzyme
LSKAKSLILITVDCLRADHVGFMGYERPTTPFLDALASESLVFPNATVVGVPTYYSFPGIMASRFPLALGREVVGLAPGEPTLATVLQQSGYHTAALVAGNPYLSSRFGYEQGFDVWHDFLSARESGSAEKMNRTDERPPRIATHLNNFIAQTAHRAGPLGKLYDDLYFEYRQRVALPKAESWESLRRFPSADVLVDHACGWFGSLGQQPFFLWLHFMDPHAPYYPKEEALSAMGERINPEQGRYLNTAWLERGEERVRKHRKDIVSLYDAGIRWVDTQIARLVEFLRGRSLWDSSILVLTADHGEEFLDHGGRSHYSSRAYQEMLHVPLLIRVPGSQKVALSEAPFSHLHLAPTVLDAMGFEAPPELAGRSYWTELHHGGAWEYSVTESIGGCTNPMEPGKRMTGRVLAVQDGRYKLVIDFDRNLEDLFDLKSDPQELRALPADINKAERARMLGIALRHLEEGTRHVNRESALRARLHEIGLEWKHPKMDSKTLAS